MAFELNPKAIQVPKNKQSSINEIATILFDIPNELQFCHHSTKSYAAHKALDKAYNETNDLKDEIIEKIIGYSGTRYTQLNLTTKSGYTEEMNIKAAKNVIITGQKIIDFAKSNNFPDIENLGQSYSGVGARLLYLLTLK